MNEPNRSFLDAHRELWNKHSFPELDFFELPLHGADFETVDAPRLEKVLLPKLRAHRLVVLAGRKGLEKSQFARHLAYLLSIELSDEDKSFQVLQWHPRSPTVRLPAALERYGSRDVIPLFLLPNLEPRHLGDYDLRRLYDDLQRRRQFAIVTTDVESREWSSAHRRVERSFWFDIRQNLLTPQFLAEVLTMRLYDLRDQLPKVLRDRARGLQPSSLLVGKHTVQSVAARLEGLSQLRSFAVALTLESTVTEAIVEKILKHLLDEGPIARHWFRHLESRDQALVLGLTLLDGLLDDQFFAALEVLVHRAWREWDPSLLQFDYHELSRARPYWRAAGELSRDVRLDCITATCRNALLEEGWLLHRRRILTSLPLLAEIARSSPAHMDWDRPVPPGDESPEQSRAEDGEAETAAEGDEESVAPRGDAETRASGWYKTGPWRDMFGNRARTHRFLHCLAATLSRIGWISEAAIEPTLLELAQSDRSSVQGVAAEALARWRDPDRGTEGTTRLFRLLKRWRTEAFQKQYAQYRRRGGSATLPFGYVRATIALTVSRSSLYDASNQLDPTLIALFEDLVQDRHPIVRNRICNDTVPRLVTHHLQQLNEDGRLWKLAVEHDEFLVAIATGMAGAFALRPTEAHAILEQWRLKALAIPGRESDEKPERERAHALSVVALTLGLITPTKQAGPLPAQEIFKILTSLLQDETDARIRVSVLAATIRQAASHLRDVATWIQGVISALAIEERDFVLDQLTRLYLKQRQNLSLRKRAGRSHGGGESKPARPTERYRRPATEECRPETYEEIEGEVYGLWIEKPRPATELERVLRRWARDARYPEALQVAIECFERLAETAVDRKEHELRQKAEEERQQAEDTAEQEEKVAKQITRRRLSLAGHAAILVAWICRAPRFHRGRWKVLRASLPELVRWRPERSKEWREALVRLWNGGKIRWHLLDEPDVMSAFLNVPKPDEHPFLRRLTESESSADHKLARQLTWACWLHAVFRPAGWVLLPVALLSAASLAIVWMG